MALKLAKTTDEGFTVEYWRVNPFMSVDMVGRAAYATLMAFKDAASRQGGKRPVHVGPELAGFETVQSVELTGQDFETALATGDLRAAMYGKLKALAFFTGSEDV